MNRSHVTRLALHLAAFAGLLLIPAVGARADSTYTYSSQPYTTWSEFVPCPASNVCQTTGSLTFANPLPDDMSLQAVTPEAYSFTDGVTVLDNTNSNIQLSNYGGISLATNASGQIVQWIFAVAQDDAFSIEGNSFNLLSDESSVQNLNYDAVEFDIYHLNSNGNLTLQFVEYAADDTAPGAWVGGGTTQMGGGGSGGGGGLSPTPEA
ncbi:MAG: hypothetical protein WAM01_12115 [Candidatus Acidiferrales bacterium]